MMYLKYFSYWVVKALESHLEGGPWPNFWIIRLAILFLIIDLFSTYGNELNIFNCI